MKVVVVDILHVLIYMEVDFSDCMADYGKSLKVSNNKLGRFKCHHVEVRDLQTH